jgi:hypothetical protein
LIASPWHFSFAQVCTVEPPRRFLVGSARTALVCCELQPEAEAGVAWQRCPLLCLTFWDAPSASRASCVRPLWPLTARSLPPPRQRRPWMHSLTHCTRMLKRYSYSAITHTGAAVAGSDPIRPDQ